MISTMTVLKDAMLVLMEGLHMQRERERKRERQSEGQRETERARQREGETKRGREGCIEKRDAEVNSVLVHFRDTQAH